MKNLNNLEAKNLRIIRAVDEIPENAKYYTFTATEFGKNGKTYFRLLNADFEDIECVNVLYTNALANLVQVSDEADKLDYKSSRMVYHLTNRNDKGFWICEKIDYGNN